MNRGSAFLAVWAAMALGLSAAVFAGDGTKADLELKRVSLFKNGIGYFSCGTTLPDAARTVDLGQLPVPSLGTFWVYYPRDVKVKGLFTKLVETEKEIPAGSILEILRLNAGMPVEILTNLKDMEKIKGTVVSAGQTQVPQEPPSPYVMGPRIDSSNPRSSVFYNAYNTCALLVKTEDGGIVALSAGSVVGAKFLDEKAAIKGKLKQKLATMRLELGEAAGGKKIAVNYLARGVTWMPSYQIDLSDPKKARLTAKALIINEVADLKGVALDLVTGFPHMKFADVNSPMAMTQDLAGFLKALAEGRSEGRSGTAYLMGQQAMTMNDPYFARPTVPIADYSTAPKGTTAEDLFLYPVKSITLAKGETAYVPLFTAELDYHHIYTWRIGDVLDEHERYDRRREQEQQKGEEVWHSCRLKNSMDMPWTTAAAEFVKDGRFIGQDVCYYTASGTETTVRITRAMNVVAEQSEVEVKRERNAKNFYGYRYDLVTLKGTLKVLNKTGKRIKLEIKKDLSGEVLETSHDARDVKVAKGLKRVNPRHTLTWEVDMAPGTEEKLSYTYTVYIRG
jgi:hypothetical protein